MKTARSTWPLCTITWSASTTTPAACGRCSGTTASTTPSPGGEPADGSRRLPAPRPRSTGTSTTSCWSMAGPGPGLPVPHEAQPTAARGDGLVAAQGPACPGCTVHNEAFRALGGIPATVRVDNTKTAVSRGAGPWGELNPSYRRYARAVRFHIDACLPRSPEHKGKVERDILDRQQTADVRRRHWDSWDRVAGACRPGLDQQLADRRICPATGTSVLEAWSAGAAAAGAAAASCPSRSIWWRPAGWAGTAPSASRGGATRCRSRCWASRWRSAAAPGWCRWSTTAGSWPSTRAARRERILIDPRALRGRGHGRRAAADAAGADGAPAAGDRRHVAPAAAAGSVRRPGGGGPMSAKTATQAEGRPRQDPRQARARGPAARHGAPGRAAGRGGEGRRRPAPVPRPAAGDELAWREERRMQHLAAAVRAADRADPGRLRLLVPAVDRAQPDRDPGHLPVDPGEPDAAAAGTARGGQDPPGGSARRQGDRERLRGHVLPPGGAAGGC